MKMIWTSVLVVVVALLCTMSVALAEMEHGDWKIETPSIFLVTNIRTMTTHTIKGEELALILFAHSDEKVQPLSINVNIFLPYSLNTDSIELNDLSIYAYGTLRVDRGREHMYYDLGRGFSSIETHDSSSYKEEGLRRSFLFRFKDLYEFMANAAHTGSCLKVELEIMDPNVKNPVVCEFSLDGFTEVLECALKQMENFSR